MTKVTFEARVLWQAMKHPRRVKRCPHQYAFFGVGLTIQPSESGMCTMSRCIGRMCRHFCSFQPTGELKGMCRLHDYGTVKRPHHPHNMPIKKREKPTQRSLYREKTRKGSGNSSDSSVRKLHRCWTVQTILLLLCHEQHARKQQSAVMAYGRTI